MSRCGDGVKRVARVESQIQNGIDGALHPGVEEILRSGRVPTHDGRVVHVHSHIPRDECQLLYRQVAATRATEAVEVGLAFGISTLCICDAMCRNMPLETGKRPHLVVMDPAQHGDGWQGLGLQQVQSSAFGDVVEFHERTSQSVLPELVAKGHRVQFAFIDGWHTFDHTLIDFFYVDQMMEIGGVVVFDDVGFQAINAVVRFVLANRDYELVEALQHPRTDMGKRWKHHMKRLLRRLGRTDKNPSERQEELFRQLEGVYAAALRKVGPDSRRWDHYNAF
jgi:Methyltransferase domain